MVDRISLFVFKVFYVFDGLIIGYIIDLRNCKESTCGLKCA